MLAFGAEHLSAELQSPRGSSACGTGALGTDGRMIEEAIVHTARIVIDLAQNRGTRRALPLGKSESIPVSKCEASQSYSGPQSGFSFPMFNGVAEACLVGCAANRRGMTKPLRTRFVGFRTRVSHSAILKRARIGASFRGRMAELADAPDSKSGEIHFS
jgi:hypothetical protein